VTSCLVISVAFSATTRAVLYYRIPRIYKVLPLTRSSLVRYCPRPNRSGNGVKDCLQKETLLPNCSEPSGPVAVSNQPGISFRAVNFFHRCFDSQTALPTTCGNQYSASATAIDLFGPVPLIHSRRVANKTNQLLQLYATGYSIRAGRGTDGPSSNFLNQAFGTSKLHQTRALVAETGVVG
jgi:hypothetical protein